MTSEMDDVITMIRLSVDYYRPKSAAFSVLCLSSSDASTGPKHDDDDEDHSSRKSLSSTSIASTIDLVSSGVTRPSLFPESDDDDAAK